MSTRCRNAVRAGPAATTIAFAAALLCGGCATPAQGPTDLALWRIVERGCNGRGPHAADPTLQCEGRRGYAVLKDRCGATHFLLIPTARRVGVEARALQSPTEPNYFAWAWRERTHTLRAARVRSGVTVPDDDVGLAVNSRYARSQEQLHIHIDRIDPGLRVLLRALPTPLPAGATLEWNGHRYRVDRVADLTQSPFRIAARDWGARTRDERARLTIAVVHDGDRGFLVLSDAATWWRLDRGHAEELLEPRRCR